MGAAAAASGVFDRTVRHAGGHPANPLSDAAPRAKHERALRHAMPEERVPGLLGFVSTVTDLPLHWTR